MSEYGWLTNASKDILILIPATCKFVILLGKRDFADVVKLRMLRFRKLSCIIWVGPVLSNGPL